MTTARVFTTPVRATFEPRRHRIYGTVNELGVKGSYPVRLFDRKTAQFIKQTWSNAAGEYAFNYIPYKDAGYFVVAHDYGANPSPYAGIMDYVTPERMATYPTPTFSWNI